MKKFFSTAIAVFMMAIMPVMAQNNNSNNESATFDNSHLTTAVATQTSQEDDLCKNEVSVSVGYGNVVQFCNAIFGGMLGKDNAAEYVINADYSHRLGRKVSLGATLNYFEGQKNSEILKDRYYTIMPHVKVDYMNNKYITLYGKAALGMMIHDYKGTSNDKEETETKVYGAFQISPFGIEAGPNKHLRVFTEVGIGMNGYIQAGLRYKF